MEVGNSFFVPTLKPANMLYVIETSAKRSGVKVKCFITTKEDHLGVRVWRLP